MYVIRICDENFSGVYIVFGLIYQSAQNALFSDEDLDGAVEMRFALDGVKRDDRAVFRIPYFFILFRLHRNSFRFSVLAAVYHKNIFLSRIS